MKKELILIATYCNTEKKVEVLDETIEYIKNIYPNIDIAIYAHYPINEVIQNKVNHYIYDYSNPLVKEKSLISWINIFNFKYLNKLFVDYGYAVLQKMSRSFYFFEKLNYGTIYWINYDIDLKKSDVISFFQKKEKENVFINFKSTENSLNFDGVSLVAIKMNTNLCNILKREISKEKYISTQNIAEQEFKDIVNKMDENKYEFVDYEVNSKIALNYFYYNSNEINQNLCKYFKRILFAYDKSEKKYCLIIWDLVTFEDINIELLVDDNKKYFSPEDNLSKVKEVLYYHFDKKPSNVKIIKINNEEFNSFIYNENIEELNKNLFIKNFV